MVGVIRRNKCCFHTLDQHDSNTRATIAGQRGQESVRLYSIGVISENIIGKNALKLLSATMVLEPVFAGATRQKEGRVVTQSLQLCIVEPGTSTLLCKQQIF